MPTCFIAALKLDAITGSSISAPSHSGWARSWFNYGGLNRPVTLVRLGPSELGALTVRTRLEDGRERARVDISVRVRNRDAGRSLRLRGAISRGGRTITPLDFGVAGVGDSTSRELKTTVMIDDPALWSPSSPTLYDLRIDVPGEASLRRRIGLREIAWDATGLQLNGGVWAVGFRFQTPPGADVVGAQ